MALVDLPHVLEERPQQMLDGNGSIILGAVLRTDLVLDATKSGYDRQAVEALERDIRRDLDSQQVAGLEGVSVEHGPSIITVTDGSHSFTINYRLQPRPIAKSG